jgi:hypothetical protein
MTGGDDGLGEVGAVATHRFREAGLPTLLLDAYPDRPVTFDRALELVSDMKPTPPFRDGT